MEGETQNERDHRVEKLWRTLDTRQEGQLDLNGLKKGLKKMDHPLKNADALLRDVLKAVDTSGDGQIQYNEFRVFVEHAEKELRQLFESIDRDHNGELDKGELKAAFSRAGLSISNAKLDQFFEEVDTNHDGVISFDEWRDFLLFIPAVRPNLRIVLSYYSATGTLNPEGDVHINETFEGLGTDPTFLSTFIMAPKNFYTCFFRSSPSKAPKPSQGPADSEAPVNTFASSELPLSHNVDLKMDWIPLSRPAAMWMLQRRTCQNCKRVLTSFAPDPGYFTAGGIAGAVSRTATAPLDRLKVYLIAQTGTGEAAIDAAKSGAPLKAVRHASSPLVEATKELWRVGGIRSLFAGNGLNVVKVMPESAIKFGAYEASKRAFAKLEGHGDPKKLHPVSQFLAGGIGGMISQCFVYPLDTLKFRMQCETVEGGLHGNQLIAETAKKMWRANGFRAYYRGLIMGLAGMFPYAAIDLTTFEYLKQALVARKAIVHRCHEEDVPLGNFGTGVIGAFSGAFSASVVYPVNLLRTRLQAQGTVLHTPTYTGIVDVTRKTIQGEGVRGLFKGITPNLLKVAPAVSISYIVYENSKKALGLE